MFYAERGVLQRDFRYRSAHSAAYCNAIRSARRAAIYGLLILRMTAVMSLPALFDDFL